MYFFVAKKAHGIKYIKSAYMTQAEANRFQPAKTRFLKAESAAAQSLSIFEDSGILCAAEHFHFTE